MCTVLLPPGVNPIAINKYIISYQLALLLVNVLGDRCSNRSKGLKNFCLGTQAQFLNAEQDHRLLFLGFSEKVNCSCCLI